MCGFAIVFTRSKTQLFFQVYLTAGMLVVVSWSSFLVNPNIVPGRMWLLVTLLLVLVNIFNGFKNSSPPSTDLNALDVYLITCICHVFCVLVEYAIVLLIDNSNIRNSLASCYILYDKNKLHAARDEGNQTNGEQQLYQLMNKFDSTSLIMFPLIFILTQFAKELWHRLISICVSNKWKAFFLSNPSLKYLFPAATRYKWLQFMIKSCTENYSSLVYIIIWMFGSSQISLLAISKLV